MLITVDIDPRIADDYGELYRELLREVCHSARQAAQRVERHGGDLPISITVEVRCEGIVQR